VQTIYEAANPIDAQRVIDLLASEGIAAHVTGAYLSGAIGEIPAGGLVRVWVDDADVEAALAVLAEDAAAPPFVDADDDDVVAPVAPAPRPRSLMLPVFGSLLAGGVFGAVLAAGFLGSEAESRPADLDGDGQVDYTEEFQGDVLQTIRIDRNHDGAIDQITETAARSDFIVRSDDDFDGDFERELRYSNWMPAWEDLDADGDGTPEWRTDFKHGVVLGSTLRHPDTDAVIKRVTFAGGIPVLEEFDADGDGSLETVRHYDSRGEITP
jgi:hypothetical protein